MQINLYQIFFVYPLISPQNDAQVGLSLLIRDVFAPRLNVDRTPHIPSAPGILSTALLLSNGDAGGGGRGGKPLTRKNVSVKVYEGP